MRVLEHKIPPPLVGVAIAGLMWAGACRGAAIDLHAAVRIGVALMIALAGAGFALAGVLSFRSAKTTVNPLKPETASALVTSGVYRVTRNPMYVGMLFVLVAWAVYLSSPWALLGPAGFALYITRFQIVPEERALAAMFGDAFADYRARVRRWL